MIRQKRLTVGRGHSTVSLSLPGHGLHALTWRVDNALVPLWQEWGEKKYVFNQAAVVRTIALY